MNTSSTYNILLAKGFKPSKELMVRHIISTEKEEGKSYTLHIGNGNQSALFQIDGNIIKQGEKSDKLITLLPLQTDVNIEANSNVFIELKGTDIKHALEQLITTIISFRQLKYMTNERVYARIVSTNFPSNTSNPTIEKLKIKLAKLKVNFKRLKNGQQDVL